MAAAAKAKHWVRKISFIEFIEYYLPHRIDTFRGCVTTSREWLFFVFNPSDVGGTLSYMQPLELEKNLSNLPLILGLL